MSGEEWFKAPLDWEPYSSPLGITAPVLHGRLEVLPLSQMSWPNFERLQWRILRDVLGHRDALIYGNPGQAQHGLDVLALSSHRAGTALQSKKTQNPFGDADLRRAVETFKDRERPFEVDKFIVGVSQSFHSTDEVHAIVEMREVLAPVEFEVWDVEAISAMLRDRPDIVIEYFGEATARAFCLPFSVDPPVVPGVDAAGIREALARTPEESTGAGRLLRQARNNDTHPEDKLRMIERAQQMLRDAGFPLHAAEHNTDRHDALKALGRAAEAASDLVSDVVAALDRGSLTFAGRARSRLHSLAADEEIKTLVSFSDAAILEYSNPLGRASPLNEQRSADGPSAVWLSVLSGELALANHDKSWFAANGAALQALDADPDEDPLLWVRLQLLIAEATQEWAALLRDARTLRLGYEASTLVLSRRARWCAYRQQFEEADALWDEAAADATLAKRWTDATSALFSRRAFRARWKPGSVDQLLTMQRTLAELPPSAPIVAVQKDAFEQGLSAFRRQRRREAAINTQRALRDAVVAGNWPEEEEARKLLAAVLIDSGEPTLGALHLILAGDAGALKRLASGLDKFVDVIQYLHLDAYWMVGATYRFLAAQGDLVPDTDVARIIEHVLSDIEAAAAGTLIDIAYFDNSRYSSGFAVLAALSDRMGDDQADKALSFFESLPAVGPGQYRRHDESESITVANISLSHESLRVRATTHLIALAARSQEARSATVYRAIDKNFDHAEPWLTELAEAGDGWATEMLAMNSEKPISPEAVDAAIERLSTPLDHNPGYTTVGTNAIGDSLLARSGAPSQVEAAVVELLERAADGRVAGADRGEYLVAAANLATGLAHNRRSAHFDTALALAEQFPASYNGHDEGTHPLSAYRIDFGPGDHRDRAAFTAATLAVTPEQKVRLRTAVYNLISAEADQRIWITKALQTLGAAVVEDIGFLAGQGWALRCLAAQLWVEFNSSSPAGIRLARDPDVRVRQALAFALSKVQTDDETRALAEVVVLLQTDTRYSVRKLVARIPEGPG